MKRMLNATRFLFLMIVFVSFLINIYSCKGKTIEHYNALLVFKTFPGKLQKVRGVIINNKKEGLWIDYDDSGLIRTEKSYIHDSISGECINFHDDGQTILSRGFLLNNEFEGEWSFYYDKKRVAEHGIYHNGKKLGIWEYYTIEGKLDKKIKYFEDGSNEIIENHNLMPPVPK
jgi:antitoxin component YwqK of YwqJK toxin-antitoxin module